MFLSVVFLDANHGGRVRWGKDSSRWTIPGWATGMAFVSRAVMPTQRLRRDGGSRRKDVEIIYVPTSYFHYYYFGLS